MGPSQSNRCTRGQYIPCGRRCRRDNVYSHERVVKNMGEEKELMVLKLDEISESIWNTFIVLFGIIAIISIIDGYGIFRFIYTIGVLLILFLLPILCIISGILIVILRKLNYAKTDGDWGILDLMKSVYSLYWNEVEGPL